MARRVVLKLSGEAFADPGLSYGIDPATVSATGTKIKLGKYGYFKNAITYYQFDNVKNTTLDYTSKSNTLRKFENTLKYDYDALAFTGELGWKTPYARMPFVALFGEAVKNTSAGQGDTGYAAGFRVG